jgi:hypothetical protein
VGRVGVGVCFQTIIARFGFNLHKTSACYSNSSLADLVGSKDCQLQVVVGQVSITDR